MATSGPDSSGRYKLPPLILHPFAEPSAPATLMEGSRASLILEGLLPGQQSCPNDLERRVLDGRYCELSMLFYVGKDVLRWADQSLQFVLRHPELRSAGFRQESFLALLIEDPPCQVDQKLRSWGVQEYKRIFSRAVALHAIFAQLPPRELLADNFLRHYHRFADHLYACAQQLFPFTVARSAQFDFELYASGEYARLLEQQWESSDT